ncbi:MAG TPA: C13 family peptidase [Casimicrobiaceae bacterium]|nr:C13 family peptidase [Casimicrobiaceae bacterium]
MRASMPLSFLRDLGRNLASGGLMVFGQRVTRLAFRISLPQLLALFVVSALLDIGVDAVRQEPGAIFTLSGLVSEGFYASVILLFAAALALAFRQPGYTLALPVILLSGEWPLQVVRMVVDFALGENASLSGYELRADQVLLAWTLFWLWRSAAVSLSPGRPYFWLRSTLAAALLATPLWFGSFLLPGGQWFETPEAVIAGNPGYPSPVAEEALIKQPELLYDALNNLDDSEPGEPGLYFVGFASFAAEDVFRKDVETARDLFDSRFDTDGRSILLINNPRTILDEPLATVSNLRATLSMIGDLIDRDQDVVMVYLTSHGTRDHRLSVAFPPLQLDSLTPDALKQMLDDAGIKWRIIVVSACYSGGFIDALKDEYTLIITASAANRTSFGCGNGSASTYFGDALFGHALRFEDSFVKAFENARERIAAREKAEHRKASEPQIFIGTEMAAKLPKLEEELRARRAGMLI